MDEIRLGSRTLQPHRQLLVNGRREPIGKRALDILSVLAEARGEIVTKDELLEQVWPGVIVEENALQVHVVALRKALGPEADRLKTIRGVGYQLDVDGEAAPASTETTAPAAAAEPAPPTAPDPGLATPAASAAERPRIWARWPSYRWAVGLTALLLVLGATFAVFGDELGLRPQERIPVVVHTLAATGTSGRTETALASGITDELILRLRRLPELRVATADAHGNVPGNSFGNAYVVDGSIRRSGDKLRVTARLLDADGEILWSQTFDRALGDLFDVQEQIAVSIADALSVSFDVGLNSVAFGGTNNPDAYAAFVRSQSTPFDSGQTAPNRHLQRALAIDPNYVQALNALSTAYVLQSNFARSRAEALALLKKADESTARAIAANPKLWSGHVARGWYFANRHDFVAYAQSFARAAELNDGTDPELVGNLAAFAINNGRNAEGLALLDAQEAIDPIRRYNGSRVWALTNRGDHRQAIEFLDVLKSREPAAHGSAAQRGFWSHLVLNGEADALRFAEEWDLDLGQELLAFKAETALPTMSAAELRRWATDRYGDVGGTQLAHRALFAGYFGHRKLSVDLLRLASERIGGYTSVVLWFPTLEEVRSTDQFERLVADMGLVKMWRETGDWPDACHPVSAREITCT